MQCVAYILFEIIINGVYSKVLADKRDISEHRIKIFACFTCSFLKNDILKQLHLRVIKTACSI